MTVEAKPVAWITADAIESLQADGMCALSAGRKQSAVYSVPIYTNPVPAQGAVMVDELAQETRRVDGNHSLGAGALAEALMPFLTALHSPSHSGEREALERAQKQISNMASLAYGKALDKFGEAPCLGWEAKVKSGEYGSREHEAHAEANKLMGRHQGLAEAARLIRAALEAKQP